MAQIKISYGVDDQQKTFVIRVPVDATVGDFLDLARQKDNNPNYRTVWQEGALIDNAEIINDLNANDDLLMISTTDEAPAAVNDTIVNPLNIDMDDDNDLIRSIAPAQRYPVIEAIDQLTQYTLFISGSARCMLNGFLLEFDKNDTPNDVINKIKDNLNQINDLIIPPNPEIFVFLPGGIPFLSGTIGDYTDSTVISHPHLYVIITRHIGNLVNRVIDNVCDCSNNDMKLLLSPICESTENGYSQIASLLGYIQHQGNHSEKLFLTLAKITRFAPLITSYYRFFESAEMNGLNIISITSCLHTFCSSILPENMDPINVFDSLLKCCSFICQMKDLKFLKLDSFDWEDNPNDDKVRSYCRKTSQQKHLILWLNDTTEPGYEGNDILRPDDPNIIQSIFVSRPGFKPLPPLSVHYVFSCTFMRSNHGCSLFLQESDEIPDTIEYIDPFVGQVQSTNVNDYARSINDMTLDKDAGLVDPDQIQQIMQIAIDESSSMNWQLSGRNSKNCPEKSRIYLTKQYFQAIFSRISSYRIACATGLLTFNNQITPRYPLSAFTVLNDNLRQAMNEIAPAGGTRLWDAIKSSADSILGFNSSDIDPNIKNYPNAMQRILVISDGEDTESEVEPDNLVQYLNDHNIIVDAVYVSSVGDVSALLSLCHCTGGLCFQLSNIDEGIQLFEKEAFMDISLRKISQKSNQFQPDITDPEYDVAPQNKVLHSAQRNVPLVTPEWIVDKHPTLPDNSRERRVIREILKIKRDNNPNVKVCVFEGNYSKWRAFIKGPGNSPYANKWLSLYIVLPDRYPLKPPLIRFITIPYHPNISDEGRPMFKEIDNSYSPALSISSFLQNISVLLDEPVLSPKYINRTEAAQYYNSNRQRYLANAQQAAAHMADDWHTYLNGVELKDADVAEDIIDNFDIDGQSQFLLTSIHRPGLTLDMADGDLFQY